MPQSTPVPIRDHTKLQNIGTNTHAQTDTHIAATASVHGVGASGFEDKANKNIASGYAGLDASSHLTPAQVSIMKTLNVMIGSRALDTNYINLNTHMVLVMITVELSTASWVVLFYSPDGNGPTIFVAEANIAGYNNFIIPLNFDGVVQVGVGEGSASLIQWNELGGILTPL